MTNIDSQIDRFIEMPTIAAHAVAIYFMHYDFVRIHQTLRCTPAMAARPLEVAPP